MCPVLKTALIRARTPMFLVGICHAIRLSTAPSVMLNINYYDYTRLAPPLCRRTANTVNIPLNSAAISVKIPTRGFIAFSFSRSLTNSARNFLSGFARRNFAADPRSVRR